MKQLEIIFLPVAALYYSFLFHCVGANYVGLNRMQKKKKKKEKKKGIKNKDNNNKIKKVPVLHF